MTHVVRYSARVLDDLDALRSWIERQSDFETARRYLIRVRKKIDSLVDFPARGRSRDDLRIGIKSLGFEGRLLIFYEINGQIVNILAVISTARDQTALDDL